MKRRLALLFFFIMSLALFSCQRVDRRFEQVFQEQLISFAEGDSIDHVTQDVALKTSSDVVTGAVISWVSENEAIIQIAGTIGIVNRPAQDTEVQLTATVTIGKQSKDKSFKLMVKGLNTNHPIESEPTVSDIRFKGVKNWQLTVGDSMPNFLNGVIATDGEGNLLPVSILYNTVDPSAVGDYVVIYEAKDGERRATKTMTVSVIPKAPTTQWLTETFDSVPFTGSSYQNFDFLGVNGIRWTAVESRTDQPLDGLSLTFKGKSNKVKLSATIPGGIQSFSVDLKAAFSNDDARSVSLYINGKKIATYDLDPKNKTDIQRFQVDHINIEGEFLLELEHQGSQVTIDNLSWLPMEKEDDPDSLLFELSQIRIPMRYSEEKAYGLPKESASGLPVAWSYVDEADENNRFFNLASGQVILPPEGLIVVYLLATLSDGQTSAQKVFTLVIGVPEIVSIAGVLDEDNGTAVETVGIVTDYYLTDQTIKFFLEDEQAGIFVQADRSFLHSIAVGNKVWIRAIKTVEHNQPILTHVSHLKVIAKDTPIEPTYLEDPDDLANHLGRYVQINGVLRQKHHDTTLDFWLVNEMGTFQLAMPEDLDDPSKEAIRNLLSLKEAGIEVTVTAGVGARGGNVFLLLFHSSSIQLESTSPNLERMAAIIQAHFVQPELPEEVTGDLVLPTGEDLLFGAVIQWRSSDESIISSEGKVTIPNHDQWVQLTYHIIFNNRTIKTHTYDLFVPKRKTYTEYYGSLEGITERTAFIKELTRIISNMNVLDYGAARYILPESDADPLNSGHVILVYDRSSVWGAWDEGKTWNREHIWPQSLLVGAARSDLHNLKPANPDINNQRGNRPFADGEDTYGIVNGGWYPGDDDKGDIARIIFYMNIRYGLPIHEMGDLEMFIRWHKEDPVDDFERYRNEVIYTYQNNRNPFIDYPDFVAIVYEYASPALASRWVIQEVKNLFHLVAILPDKERLLMTA